MHVPGTSGPSPRARGSPDDMYPAYVAHGPSPRARGSHGSDRRGGPGGRSIPACAGLTSSASCTRSCGAVHPRVRGAHRAGVPKEAIYTGPSPRARGSRPRPGLPRRPGRSIPACAGLTRGARALPVRRPVHPRVRGAHASSTAVIESRAGPSPRARGSRARGRGAARSRRSIPACAGLTAESGRAAAGDAVHPRVRGAHIVLACWVLVEVGPSPRARGSPFSAPSVMLTPRSIPACAGLTCSSVCAPRSPPVHPRVRGAHDAARPGPNPARGPSPRARGSRPVGFVRRGAPRSIPACAGLTG